MLRRLVIPCLLILFGFVRGLLDFAGYVDLIIAHHESKTETWIGKTTTFLLQILIAPPAWMAVPLVLIGGAWIYWDLKRPFQKPSFELLDDAALTVYEADEEKAEEVSMAAAGAVSPQAKHNHFKYVLLTFDEVPLYGVKPPSRKFRTIPAEVRRRLHPGEEPNSLGSLVGKQVQYTGVRVRRKDLPRIIKRYLAAASAMASLERNRGSSAKAPPIVTRMALLDFRTKAIAHGWPIYLDDARWLEFLIHLRQAASDGQVSMWGRRMKKASAAVIYGRKDPPEPILEIDKSHWATFKINWNLTSQEPPYAHSYDPTKSDWGLSAGRYQDLHVGMGAEEWLATTKVPPP
jgi:hypothetical protein